jgi:hypothetical protein
VCASRSYIEDKKSLQYHNLLAVAVVLLVRERKKLGRSRFFLTDSLQTPLITRSLLLEFLLAVRERVAGHGERQGERERESFFLAELISILSCVERGRE